MNSTHQPNHVTIPLLPGNSFGIQRKDYRKPHSLDYKCGLAVQKVQLYGIGLEKIATNASILETSSNELIQSLGSDPKLTYGNQQYHVTPVAPRFVPAFVALDKVVLRFDAYFKEPVHESNEQFHLRSVRILYYLEDDSIAIIEPPVENSGIAQQVFIKRQRLAKEDTEGAVFYTAADFNVGINLTFYGRTFRIVRCDKFTQEYLSNTEGITLNAFEGMPEDPFLALRNRPRRDFSVPSIFHTTRHNAKLEKFLAFDRQVLRFYCAWDDRASMFGELREFVLHYYLVDDCIEVREVADANNGRDPFPILLRKQPLIKDGLAGADGKQERYIVQDLHIGNTINVLGRRFLIHDCDDYTRQYFKINFNTLDEEMVPITIEHEDRTTHIEAQEAAPYNGYGTIEDSLGSCKNLVLKPPRKDFVKMLDNDHKVLRFVARMETKHEADNDRRFVISYRLSDDMITIYEPPKRNAGVIGGKFLERTRVLKNQKPNSLSSVTPLGMTTSPEYYNAPDLYIGAHLIINKHHFVLLDADEYVFNYMEERPLEFPKSSQASVMQRIEKSDLVKLVAKISGYDNERTGSVNRTVVVQEAKKIFDGISEHEIITLVRRFEDNARKVLYQTMLS